MSGEIELLSDIRDLLREIRDQGKPPNPYPGDCPTPYPYPTIPGQIWNVRID